MKLGKQAKALTDQQTQTMLTYLATTQAPERNRTIFLLSAYAGLRAKEIGALEWGMILTSEGKVSDFISLESKAAKMKSGGVIPSHRVLKQALGGLHVRTGGKGTEKVIKSKKTSVAMTAQVIVNLFGRGGLGF